MKKIILLAVIAIFTFTTSFAQEEKSAGLKGAWYGLAALNYTDDEATDTSSFRILPAVGTFISADVTIGGAIGYMSSTVGNADSVDTFIVMPFVRKYWAASDKFYFFGEANVPLTFNDTANTYGINIQPGVDYFIGGKWTIEAKFGALGYTVTDYDANIDSTNNFTAGFDMFNLNFGIKYLF